MGQGSCRDEKSAVIPHWQTAKVNWRLMPFTITARLTLEYRSTLRISFLPSQILGGSKDKALGLVSYYATIWLPFTSPFYTFSKLHHLLKWADSCWGKLKNRSSHLAGNDIKNVAIDVKCAANLIYILFCHKIILLIFMRHFFAQSLQACAHTSMSLFFSQKSAQSSHISAHIAQRLLNIAESPKNFAHDWQDAAQLTKML